jgi:hypothetical protein
LISVLKLFTPQITGKITGSILAGRGQTSALGGGGRERPSGREPPPAKLLASAADRQGRVVGTTSACRARHPHKNGINLPQNQRLTYDAETSQHERRVDHDHNDPEDDPETDAHSLRWCPPDNFVTSSPSAVQAASEKQTLTWVAGSGFEPL